MGIDIRRMGEKKDGGKCSKQIRTLRRKRRGIPKAKPLKPEQIAWNMPIKVALEAYADFVSTTVFS
jgi:hypothetical protein